MAPASGNGGSQGGQQTSVPYAAIPFLAILGAVAALLICWAFARSFGEPDDPYLHVPESQAVYMREVRQRNRQDIADLFSVRKYQWAKQANYSNQISRETSQPVSYVDV